MTATTTVWSPDFSSGISPVGADRWVQVLEAEGAAGTGDSTCWDNPRNLAGMPREYRIEQHDDFRWAASRFTEGSMAAYYSDRGVAR